MSFDDDDLRKALDERSVGSSPEFRERLRRSVAESKPSTNWMPLIAATTVIALSMTSLGFLIAARHFGRGTAASSSRVTSPSPTASPIVLLGSAQLSAPSADMVWALVNYDHLYRSTDRGNQWEQRSMPAEFGVRPSISFIGDHEGWLLAPGPPMSQCQTADSAIWHTKDAGNTWQQVRGAGIAIAQNQCKHGIWFTDARHGFVAASDPNHRPTVYRTSDGGDTWAATVLPDPAYFKSSPGGFTLQVDWIREFGSTLYLEAFGSQDRPDIPRDNQFVLKSTDGGVSWTYVTKVPSRSIVIVTDTRWLDFTAPGQAMESTNGGQQFHQYASDLNAAATQFVFADANVGYATGGTNLQRTVDGGSRWVRISTPGEPQTIEPTPSPPQVILPTAAQLAAPSDNVVWVLIDGYLFRSTDQGVTWQQRTFPRPGGGGNPVISFVDDTNGWALFPGDPSTQCQQAGADLWRTSDGAATWQVVASVTDQTHDPKGLPFDQCKEYMAFIDPAHGFVAGHDTSHTPMVSRTQDGGITWAQSTLPDPPGFKTQGGHAFSVMEIKNFAGDLLAGAQSSDGGKHVFRSTDDGASWTYLASTGANLNVPIVFVTEARWLVIFNNGSGQETTDAGKSWHTFASDYQDAAGVASTFVFADSHVGYGTVRGGIQRTADGGLHWVRLKTPGT